jgi:hypothetical protein
MLTRPRLVLPLLALLSSAFVSGAAPAQDGAAPFQAAVIMTGSFDTYRGVADLDGDGYLDALGVWPNSSSGKTCWVRGSRNQGNGVLAYMWSVEPPASAVIDSSTTAPLAIADFNLDGVPDFAVGNGDKIAVYTGNGLTAPSLHDAWGTYEVTRLLTGHFNADGRPDLAAMHGGTLEIYLNKPVHGTWTMQLQSSVYVSAGATELRPVECNGDGATDVMVADGNFVRMYPVTQGNLGAAVSFNHGLPSPKIDSGGIDNDGDLDVPIFGTGTYRILRRTGPAAFVLEAEKTGGAARFLVDIDADGDLDGICCGGGGGSIPENNKVSTFLFAVNDGTGAFAKAWTFPGLGSERVAGWGDLDHDGDLDIVAGRCVLYGKGPWTEAPAKPLGFQAGGEWNIFDYDLDGDPDVYADFNFLGRNAGNGTFATTTLITPPPPANHLYYGPGYAGDFDGDGDTDLVVQDYVNGFNNNGKRLFRNTGGGAYVDGGAATLPTAVFQVGNTFAQNVPAAGIPQDIDGDGDLDLVTRYEGSSLTASRLWINQGAGYFLEGTDFNGTYLERALDLTGDGIVDLLGRAQSAPNLKLFPGLGGGVFGLVSILGPGTPTPHSHMEVKDLDGDGDTDLALVELAGTGFAVVQYENIGGGAFNKTALVFGVAGTNSFPCNTWIEDFDGDGAPDLLTTPGVQASNGAEFRRGNGQGSFLPKVALVLPAIHALDADGDGDLDLETLQGASYQFLDNRTYMPPSDGLRRQYGASLTGKAGMPPTLGASGPFRPGVTAEFRVTGGVGGAAGILVLGAQEVSQQNFLVPGLVNYVDPWIAYVDLTLDGPSGEAGEGSWSFPIRVGPEVAGISAFLQAFLVDASSPTIVVGTNGIQIHFGN